MFLGWYQNQAAGERWGAVERAPFGQDENVELTAILNVRQRRRHTKFAVKTEE
jgi:hypothetical protein